MTRKPEINALVPVARSLPAVRGWGKQRKAISSLPRNF
jgi:hypothetical protein